MPKSALGISPLVSHVLTVFSPRRIRISLVNHALFGKDSVRFGAMLGLEFLSRFAHWWMAYLVCFFPQGALSQYTESFSIHSPFSSLLTSPSLSIYAT